MAPDFCSPGSRKIMLILDHIQNPILLLEIHPRSHSVVKVWLGINTRQSSIKSVDTFISKVKILNLSQNTLYLTLLSL